LLISSRHLNKKRMAPDSPGCCGWFKQAKHWAAIELRASACLRMCRRADVRPLEAQKMSGSGCNLTVSSFDFCLPASRAADSRFLTG
jgi:hypothetical protein